MAHKKYGNDNSDTAFSDTTSFNLVIKLICSCINRTNHRLQCDAELPQNLYTKTDMFIVKPLIRLGRLLP